MVHAFVMSAEGMEALMYRLEEILAKLVGRGLPVIAHKAMFLKDEIKGYVWLHSSDMTLPDLGRVEEIEELC